MCHSNTPKQVTVKINYHSFVQSLFTVHPTGFLALMIKGKTGKCLRESGTQWFDECQVLLLLTFSSEGMRIIYLPVISFKAQNNTMT